jgi:hypothetical protein
MRTRRGKIARLPLAIREELNTRLRNGEVGKDLLLWLNGLAPVLEVLAAQFKGKPVAPCNLSEWKKGGYADWLLQQMAPQTPASAVLQISPDPVAALQGGSADNMALLLYCHVLAELSRHLLSSNSEAQARLWRYLRFSLASLKRRENFARKNRREEAAERTGENQQDGPRAPRTPEETERAVLRVPGIDPDGPHLYGETDLFEGPGADALNQQRQRLRERMARKATLQPAAISLD